MNRSLHLLRWLFPLAGLWLSGCEEGRLQLPTEAPPVIETGTPAPLPETPAEEQGALLPVASARPPVGTPTAVITASATLTFDPPQSATVRDVRAVKLDVQVVGARGPVDVALEWLTPSGATYQVMTQPIDAAPHEASQLQFELPVQGTHIDSNNLAGQWTAQVLLNGELYATRTFEVAP